jgi:hypothetical protein
MLHEHLHRRADAAGRAVLGDVLGETGDALDPGGDLDGIDLVGQVESLRAVLVGVAEHADGVELGLGEERLELGEVLLGLAREADDDVGADAGVRVERPDLAAQREERLPGPEAPHAPQHRRARVLEGQVEVRRDPPGLRDRAQQRGPHLRRLQV